MPVSRSRKPVAKARPSAARHRAAPSPAIAGILASRAGPSVGAFIDFDGTLIPGYSAFIFLKHQLKRRELGAVDLARTAQMLVEALAGLADNQELIERGLAEWRGRGVRAMEALGEALFEAEIEGLIFPEMREIIAAHRSRGHTVVLASSATPFQVMPAARSLGLEHVLCTQLEAKKGKLTGRIDGRMLWGPGKVASVREFAAARGIDLKQSFFYADGNEDAALMHLVGHPRPTNPQEGLARIAARRGWPVMRYVSRGRPSTTQIARSLAATASALPIFLGAAAMRAITGNKRAAANLMTSTLSDISLALAGVQVRVTGEEHLWSHRPAVFIFNHRNIADAQIMGALVRRDFGAVAKKELEKNPLFAVASQFMHFAFVERDNKQAAIETLKPATRLLTEGYSMIVAPEGTRVSGVKVGPFKKGAFRMAMEAQVPLVPVVIRNADDVAPRNSGTLRPGIVDVAVLPPIAIDDWTLETLDERIEEIRQMYAETLENWPTA